MASQEYQQESFDLKTYARDLENINANDIDLSNAMKATETAETMPSFNYITELWERCKNLNCTDIKREQDYYGGKFTFLWKELWYSKHEDESREDPYLYLNGKQISSSKFLEEFKNLKQNINTAENQKAEFTKKLGNGYNNAKFDEIWFSLKKINTNDIRFSMNKGEFYYQMKSEYNYSEYVSNVTFKWWKLKINGFNKEFNIDEWLRVAALVNYIQKDLSINPIKTDGMWASWKYQRSTFWDLERDIVLSPIDKDIVKSGIVSKYFPSIKDNKEFLNYVNNLKINRVDHNSYEWMDNLYD